MDKKNKKRVDRCCKFCGEDDYDLLDVHRIKPGSKGGKYSRWNTVTACAACHRKCHSGRIIVHRWCLSSAGRVLHCVIDGKEKFL